MADEANKKLSIKTKAPKTTKKAEAYEEDRQLTKLLDRALTGCEEDIGEMADATVADCTALRPLALKLASTRLELAIHTIKEEGGYCGLAGTSIVQAGVLRTPPPELLWGCYPSNPTRETWVTWNRRAI